MQNHLSWTVQNAAGLSDRPRRHRFPGPEHGHTGPLRRATCSPGAVSVPRPTLYQGAEGQAVGRGSRT